MTEQFYYVVTFRDIVNDIGFEWNVLADENSLPNLLSCYDKDAYKLVNIFGLGPLQLDYHEFIKHEQGLETGQGGIKDAIK